MHLFITGSGDILKYLGKNETITMIYNVQLRLLFLITLAEQQFLKSLSPQQEHQPQVPREISFSQASEILSERIILMTTSMSASSSNYK